MATVRLSARRLARSWITNFRASSWARGLSLLKCKTVLNIRCLVASARAMKAYPKIFPSFSVYMPSLSPSLFSLYRIIYAHGSPLQYLKI